MEFYQITKEAMDNQTMKRDDIIEGHVYVWPTNGVQANINLPLPYPIHYKNGIFRQWIGFVDATKYNLKRCSRNEAYEACWEFGGFCNKWDNYNSCYRENLKDSDDRPVTILSMDELLQKCYVTKERILKYCQEEGYEVINK